MKKYPEFFMYGKVLAVLVMLFCTSLTGASFGQPNIEKATRETDQVSREVKERSQKLLVKPKNPKKLIEKDKDFVQKEGAALKDKTSGL